LPPGTHFKVSQGAFGCCTHNDPGHEYTWDFDVPFGTPVLSVDDGKVIQVWEPNQGGGCDPKYNDSPHNIKIEHADGTVAQYVHVKSLVHEGDLVQKRQQIAVTAMNGFICTPQLDFGIFQDRHHLYGSGQMRNIPLLFEGLPDGGMAHEGYTGAVPR
jgi:murein DD-endopeptidase MepM/ murein hydrolase activator NlpD